MIYVNVNDMSITSKCDKMTCQITKFFDNFILFDKALYND